MINANEVKRIEYGRGYVYFDGVKVRAEDLGLDAEMFAEWVKHSCQPRCGGFKVSGERCNFAPVGFKCDGLEFAQQHRVVMCHLHKQPEAQILDGGCVLIKPTQWHSKKRREETIRRQKSMGLS